MHVDHVRALAFERPLHLFGRLSIIEQLAKESNFGPQRLLSDKGLVGEAIGAHRVVRRCTIRMLKGEELDLMALAAKQVGLGQSRLLSSPAMVQEGRHHQHLHEAFLRGASG
ncbi:hypothetical protein D3C86_1336460 [compost metagenome]